MFSSQKSLQKRTIMDYLPEHQRAKVRKLVERLAQQTQQKQKFKKLYEQMTEKYEQLNKKYEELEEHCDDLKSQIATSRMAINKAKQAYIASKSAKKMKKIQDFNNNQFENQNKLDTQTLKQTWMKIPKSNMKTKNSGDKEDKKQYIFQQQNNLSKSNFNTNSHEKLYPPLPLAHRFQETSLKKTAPRKNYRDTVIQSSNKKQQIVNLRKQIQSLTQEMKKKQTTGLPLNEKIKKCQQIKNRYLKSKEKGKKRKNESQSQSNESGIQSDDQSEKKSKSRISRYKVAKSKKQIQNDKEKQQSKKSSHKLAREQRYSQDDKSDKNQSQNQQNQEQQSIEARTEHKLKKSSNNQHRNNVNKQKHEKELKKQEKEIKGSKNQYSETSKSKKTSKQETNKTERSRKEPRKLNSQSKFDQSLFAIINQLNSGN